MPVLVAEAELEKSLEKWSEKMSEHLQFCNAISQILLDIVTYSLKAHYNLVK